MKTILLIKPEPAQVVRELEEKKIRKHFVCREENCCAGCMRTDTALNRRAVKLRRT